MEQISEQLQQERQERLKRLGAASEAGSTEYPSAAPSTVGDDGRSSLHGSLQGSFVQVGSNPESSAVARPKRTKAQLWQDMKINSIARCLTLLYTLCLLTLLTRIQLNLLGRRTYLSSVVALAQPPNPVQSSRISLENNDDDNYDNAYGNDFETNRKYLTFSWWLLHRGSKAIMERVLVAVKEVFGQVNIREDVSLESLAEYIMQVRRIIEGQTEEERRSTKWLTYLLPPKEDEIFVIRQSGTGSSDSDDAFSPDPLPSSDPLLAATQEHGGDDDTLINKSLRRLLDETADLIDSPTFSFVLTRLLDTSFSHLVEYRIAVEAFQAAVPTPSGPSQQNESRITEIPTHKVKLAHILPVFCKQAHAIAVGSGDELGALVESVAAQEGALGNDYLAAIDRVQDLEGFAAVVYSSNWEYEPPEYANHRGGNLDQAGFRGQDVDLGLDLGDGFDVETDEGLVLVRDPALDERELRALQRAPQSEALPAPATAVSEPIATAASSAANGLEEAWQKATSVATEVATAVTSDEQPTEEAEEAATAPSTADVQPVAEAPVTNAPSSVEDPLPTLSKTVLAGDASTEVVPTSEPEPKGNREPVTESEATEPEVADPEASTVLVQPEPEQALESSDVADPEASTVIIPPTEAQSIQLAAEALPVVHLSTQDAPNVAPVQTRTDAVVAPLSGEEVVALTEQETPLEEVGEISLLLHEQLERAEEQQQ